MRAHHIARAGPAVLAGTVTPVPTVTVIYHPERTVVSRPRSALEPAAAEPVIGKPALAAWS